MKPKLLIPILLLLTTFRAAWVLSHEVSPSEAYYWMCSHRLAAGYFDGPAGTAFLVRAFGENFEFARVFWPVLGFFCSCCAWLFVRRIYDVSTAGWCVILLNVLPVFNLSATGVGPLMPALVSVLAGLVFARAAWDGRRWAWFGAGVFFSVALLFSYDAALIPAGLMLCALFNIRHRTPADLIGFVAITILCVAALVPALYWNSSLDWIPIAGGTWRTAWEFRLIPFLGSFGDFAMAFSVPVVATFLIGLVILLQDARRHGRAAFVVAACAAAWVWVIYVLLRGGNAVPAGLFGTAALAAFVIFMLQKTRFALPLGTFILLIAFFSSAYSLREAGLVSWKSVAAELHAAARDLPAAEGEGFFIAEDANQAAVLGCYFPDGGKYPPVFVPESPDISNQFGVWPSYGDFVESDVVADEYFKEQKGVNPFLGRNAIYLGQELPQTVKAAFQDVQPYRKIALPNGQELTIYFCLGYQTLPL